MSFRINWSRSPAPDGLLVTVQLVDRSAQPPAPADALLAPVLKVAALGAHGGLAGSSHQPASSEVKVLRAQVAPAGRVDWQLSVRNVAARSLAVLVNTVGFLDEEIAPVEALYIQAPDQLLRARELPEDGYFQPLPFSLVDDRDFITSGMDVELRFPAAVLGPTTAQVEEAYGHWLSAANVGAFASKTHPPQKCFVFPDDSRYGDDFLILSIEEMLVSPEADDALVNVLHWVHQRITPLASVELYE